MHNIKDKHLIIPFVEVENEVITTKLVNEFFKLGCDGIFLINYTVPCEELLLVYRILRKKFPNRWIGVSLNDVLAHEVLEVFPFDANGYWINDIHLTYNRLEDKGLKNLYEIKSKKYSQIKIFGQVRISNYEKEKDFRLSIQIAKNFVDVLTIKGLNSLSTTGFYLKIVSSSINFRNLGMSFSVFDTYKIKFYLPYVKYLLFFDGLVGYKSLQFDKFYSLLKVIRKYENNYIKQ